MVDHLEGNGEPPENESGGSTISSISTYVPKHNVEIQKNRTRQFLAFALLGLFAAEIFAIILLAFFSPDQIDKHVQLLAYIVTPTITLLGNVSAYYFGSRTAENEVT